MKARRTNEGDRSGRKRTNRTDPRLGRDARGTGRGGERRQRTGMYYRRGRRRTATDTVLPPHLDDDPQFNITTLDKSAWLEPYSGKIIPISEDLAALRQDYYRNHEGWRDHIPLPLATLLELRWLHDLRRLLPRVPALRIFSPQGRAWLNPYSGNLDRSVELDDGQITPVTIGAMARALTTCDEATDGKPLDPGRLEELRRKFGGVVVPDASATAHENAVKRHAAAALQAQTSHDLHLAGEIQKKVLAPLPDIDGYELAVHYSPHSDVGGDFYEILQLPDGRILIMLGDVSGHGVQGAIHVAALIKTVRIFSRENLQLMELLDRVNREIRPDLLPGQFITLFAGVLDPDASNLTCVLAGHHPLIIANPNHRHPLRMAGNRGMALGLAAGDDFGAQLHPDVVNLYPGDVLLQYSDGVEEARPNQGNAEEFGRNRIFGHLMEQYTQPLQELVDSLARRVNAYADGKTTDDITILALAVDDTSIVDSGSSTAVESSCDIEP